MYRRGMLRIGIGLLLAASTAAMAILWPKPAIPLSPPPAMLYATACHQGADIHAGDGMATFAGCWYDPNNSSNPSVTVIPCLDSGIGRMPWKNIDVFDDNSPAGAGCVLDYSGPTAVIGDSGSGPGISVIDVIGGQSCSGGNGAPGGGSSCSSGGCSSCGNDGGPSAGGNPDCFDCQGGLFSLGSVDIRISLGMANEYRSASVLKLTCEGAPSSALGTPAALAYDLKGSFSYNTSPIQVILSGSDLRQIRTSSLLADIVTTSGSTFSVQMYALSDLGSQDGTTHIYSFGISAHPFREWNVSYTTNTLTVVDRVWGSSAMQTRATYIYEYDSGDKTWTLTTKDASNTVVRTEVMTDWTYVNATTRTRTYTAKLGVTPIYSYSETQVDITTQNDWRRTELTVDPGGDERTTTWTWSTSVTGSNGVVLTEVTRPDGSWTTFSYTYSSGVWTITTTSPWEDGGSNLTIVRTFEKETGTNAYRIKNEVASIGATDVSRTEWAYSAVGGGHTTVESRYVDLSAPVTLDTTYVWHYYDLAGTRYDGALIGMDSIENPDGTSTVYSESDSGLTPGAYPSSHSPTGGSAYHVHTVESEGSSGLVNNKSTQTSTYVDGAGRPRYSETMIRSSGAWAGPIRWTNWDYDDQGRETARWSDDGSLTETAYTPCCGRTITDPQGIATDITRDVLGRVTEVSRAGIVTTYDYSTPLETTMVTAPEDPNSPVDPVTTVTTVDTHGRTTKVVTNSGESGALAILYDYDHTGAGGEKLTVYSDYPSGSSSGTANVRDRITEYYCDGRVKKVSGATVIETAYAYSGSGSGFTTEVTTGPSSHTTTETTTYDPVGRVAEVERDGWAASGNSTLTTTYTYDDATSGQKGRLKEVAATSQPSTLYAYDTMGRVNQTAIDVNSNDSIDTSGTDRISESESTIEQITDGVGTRWWSIQKSYTRPTLSSGTQLQTSEQRTRLTGYTGSKTSPFSLRESVSIDSLTGNTTTTTTTIERDVQTRTETTDVPDSSTDAVSTYVNGKLTSSTTAQGVETDYGYDDLHRQITVTDARGNTTTTAYDSSGRVATVTDAHSDVTTYAYYVGGDTGATTAGSGVWPGRVKSISNPDTKYTYFAYTDRGENWRTWGDVPYPVEYDYDGRGRQHTMTTYRGGTFNTSTWPGSPGTADVTTWNYHDGSGLLNSKVYQGGDEVDYTYTDDGKLASRTWARGVMTNYSYYLGGGDPFTGELKTVNYGDSTPDVTYTYDRMGNIATVNDAVGDRTLAYDLATTLRPTSEKFESGNLYGSVIYVSQDYESGAPYRWDGAKIGTSAGNGSYYSATYGYDGFGRLETVAGPGLPAGGATYTYLQHSGDETGLPEKTLFKDGTPTVKAWSKWTYAGDRNLVESIENNFGDETTYSAISKYEYANDDVGRRTSVIYTGVAFSADHHDAWAYNDRNEVTGTTRKSGTTVGSGSETTGARRAYAYDNIGNRDTYTKGTGAQTTYETNALNQYENIETASSPVTGQNMLYDEDGNVSESYVVGDFDGDGSVGFSDLAIFSSTYSYCEGDPQYDARANLVTGSSPECIDSSDQAAFMSLFGLSATSVMRAQMEWDAENRLVAYIPLNQSGGAKKVTFKYDYRGRRVEKNVYAWNSGGSAWYTNPTERRRYMWNGWLMLREVIDIDAASDGTVDSTRTKTYTWGKDLGGGLESAGGIGGLLAVYDDNATTTGGSPTADDLAYVYMYDANGNVGQLCDLSQSTASASIVAKYEYDAYGNVTASGGAYVSANTYRFSTKPWDDETGLGCWRYRYFDPRLGRWVGRDPLVKPPDRNIYVYVKNAPAFEFDVFGDQTGWTNHLDWCDLRPGYQLPPSPKRRTPGECCADALKAGITKGNEGSVVCCDGRKIACAWYQHTGNPEEDYMTNIYIECTTAHELAHFKATQPCPDAMPSLEISPFIPGKQNECEGYSAALDCYKRKKADNVCSRAPNPKACESSLDEAIRIFQKEVDALCGK